MKIHTTAVNPTDLYPKFGGSNMKKMALLALLVLALGGARIEAGSAVAGNDARIDSNIDRNIIRFTATYENIIGGTFTCVGFRIHNPRVHKRHRAVYSYRPVLISARYLRGQPGLQSERDVLHMV
jgi:hypothetical protein